MAFEKTKQRSKYYDFDCESVPIAPVTKNHARLARDGESDARSSRVWWFAGIASIAALAAGLVIGRFAL